MFIAQNNEHRNIKIIGNSNASGVSSYCHGGGPYVAKHTA
uniref:Uncharacterized protein n=1 Tax=Arundo donax TaxID=35708 RepID=A0A0A8Y4W2_ARUDO